MQYPKTKKNNRVLKRKEKTLIIEASNIGPHKKKVKK